MNSKRGTVVLALLAVTAWQALAQTSPSVVCNQDNYNATRYVGARNCARTPAGDLVVVFEPGQLYTNQDIWSVTWDAATQTWGVPVQVSQAQNTHTGTPAVAADENGRIHAYWKEKNLAGDRDAMYAYWENGSWSTPVVADNIDNNAGVGTIEVAADGSIFNAFSIWDLGSNYDANFYAGHSTDGVTWETTNLTSVFPTPDILPLSYLDISLAAAPDGRMYAAWEDKPYGSTWECMLAEFDGTTWQIPEVASTVDDSLGALRYVDGVTPAAGAQAVYEMGPDDYVLADYAVSVYSESGDSRRLASWFNLRYSSPTWNRDEYVADVVDFFGPGNILVVDDDNRFNHETYLYQALGNNGIAFDTLDTDADGDYVAVSPPSYLLEAYDLVIWFCGDDGGNIAFWEDEGTFETDNPNVISYLDNGGDLWVMGLDVLYDRYGGAPVTFAQGDFCHDYLGMDSYDVQSYLDDGHEGLLQIDAVPGNGITDVEHQYWGIGGVRQGEPSIAVTSDGTVHMVYVENNCIYHRAKANGVWDIPVRVDASADTMSTMRPNISRDDQDGLYVTWKEETGADQNDNAIYNIMYATSRDGGLTWCEPVQLSQATEVSFSGYSVMRATIGSTVRPPIPGVFDGGADVIWTQWNPQSDLGYDIMYGRIPYLWLSPVENLQISVSGTNVHLIWDEVPGANSYRIYSSSVPYGEFTTLEATVAGTAWDGFTNGEEKRFYYVIAVQE
jgi:hypothetical protein